jgi:hypothetical protein
MTTDLTCRHGYHECKVCQAPGLITVSILSAAQDRAIDPMTGMLVPRRKIWAVGEQLVTPLHPDMIISQYLSTPEGRRKLAESMVPTLRPRRRSYTDLIRAAFPIQPMPVPNALIFYYSGARDLVGTPVLLPYEEDPEV